jgi:hypothetical protein
MIMEKGRAGEPMYVLTDPAGKALNKVNISARLSEKMAR